MDAPDQHDHPAAVEPETLLADVDEERRKASGPGGQHRNKVETGVRLRHRPTGLTAEAAERRSQKQNRDEALRRLRLKLALETRSELALDAFVPSALWARRTGGGSLSVAGRHADVPALLAEALDVLAAAGDDPSAAARALGVSTSRFLRVLRLEASVLEALNRRRRARGERPYT